jgi:hypothetical protein
MAYTDLVSSQVTLIPNGGAYNFAFDLPAAKDQSPALVSMGLQLDMTQAVAPNVLGNGFGNLISNCRVQVGSTVTMDYNANAAANAASVGQFSVMVQRVGGTDSAVNTNIAGLTTIGEVTWPIGLDASRSHRVNISVTLGDEAALMGGQALVAGTSNLNVILNYGVATESTIFGGRQDFICTGGATRTLVVDGRDGWQMLGVYSANDTVIQDGISQCRVNNGAFRELTAVQWRGLNGSYGGNSSLVFGNQPDQTAAGAMPNKVFLSGQAGALFFNLRRISAGANIEMAITAVATAPLATATIAFYPVWVQTIGAKSGSKPRQTAVTVDSTTKTVEAATTT